MLDAKVREFLQQHAASKHLVEVMRRIGLMEYTENYYSGSAGS